MKALVTLTLFAVALCARAELAIYNFTGTLTLAGNGFATVVRPKGVLLWDVDTGRAYQVATFTTSGAKRLVVADRSESSLFQSFATKSTYTAVLDHTVTDTGTETTESSEFIFGANAVLTLRPGRTISLPRTGRSTGYAINQVNSSGVTVMGPATGTYSFSAKQSAAANLAGLSLETVLQQTRAKYQAQGYVE